MSVISASPSVSCPVNVVISRPKFFIGSGPKWESDCDSRCRGIEFVEKDFTMRRVARALLDSSGQALERGLLKTWVRSTVRPKISTSCLRNSTGKSGPDVASNERGSSDRVLQAVREWTWGGFRRGMSREVRQKRDDDEGDWRYSPEWWGTQDGGWGHNSGEKMFEAASMFGNGVVSVTAHPASRPSPREMQAAEKNWKQEINSNAKYQILQYEWRVLRFNTVTRQSVAKVKAVETSPGKVILLQHPDCIAFEYIKSMISAGLAAVSLSGLDLQHVRGGYQKMRILCIGLGGGSLPLFLAHHLSGATVEVVEIDAVVISAAIEMMGFPPCAAVLGGGISENEAILWGGMLQRIIVHADDGEAFVCKQAQKVVKKEATVQYDLVFVDAFDGEDIVPPKLWDRSGPFLSSLNSLLHPDHGTVVVNLHNDSISPSILERISGKFGPGFDSSLSQGRRIQEAALAYRDILLSPVTESNASGTHVKGTAFTIAVAMQGNISLVVSRGAAVEPEASDEKAHVQAFVAEAKELQQSLEISFDMSKRVSRGFQTVQFRQKL